MGALLCDLRGGPDITVLRVGDTPSAEHRPFYLRVSPLGASGLEKELSYAASSGAAGVVLPGAIGRPDIERLGAMLAVAESEADLPDDSLRVLAITADTPAGVLALPTLSANPRLVGLACSPAELARTLGCENTAPAIVAARSSTVLAAAACRVRATLLVRVAAPDVCRAALGEGFAALLVTS